MNGDPKDQGDRGRDGFGHGTGHTSSSRGDGDHHTAFGEGSHISWDSDRNGDYVTGSGHSRDHGSGHSVSWDDR